MKPLVRKIRLEAAITLKAPPLPRICPGASAQVGLVCSRETSVSAALVWRFRWLFFFSKEKRMHHFWSAFALPPSSECLWQPVSCVSFLVPPWKVTLPLEAPVPYSCSGTSSSRVSHPREPRSQRYSLSTLDARMMTDGGFSLLPGCE